VTAGLLLLELEVNAGQDVHAAAGDTDVECGDGAELERSLEQANAVCVQLYVEEAGAAEYRDGQRERILPQGKREVEDRPPFGERQLDERAEADVREREDADARRWNRNRETRVYALRVDIQARAVAQETGRNQLTQRFDK